MVKYAMRSISQFIFPIIFWPVVSAAAPIHVGHGEIVCATTGWDDVILFILTNYVAHAITAVKFPGESHKIVNLRRLDMLLVPFVGLMYAMRKVEWFLIAERNPLTRACRGEALAMVVRTQDWVPEPGICV
jgi:hypothetical protein